MREFHNPAAVPRPAHSRVTEEVEQELTHHPRLLRTLSPRFFRERRRKEEHHHLHHEVDEPALF